MNEREAKPGARYTIEAVRTLSLNGRATATVTIRDAKSGDRKFYEVSEPIGTGVGEPAAKLRCLTLLMEGLGNRCEMAWVTNDVTDKLNAYHPGDKAAEAPKSVLAATMPA